MIWSRLRGLTQGKASPQRGSKRTNRQPLEKVRNTAAHTKAGVLFEACSVEFENQAVIRITARTSAGTLGSIARRYGRDVMSENFVWNKAPLSLARLDAVAENLKRSSTPGTARFNYIMNVAIITYFLGHDWFEKHAYLNAHSDSYLRPNFIGDHDIDRIYSIQIVELAELLLNLQFVRGFPKILEHLSLKQIESGLAEMHVGQCLKEKGIPFKYVEDTDNTNVDIILEAPDGSVAYCEIKCKYESTDYSENTINSSFRKAARQIGKGNSGVLFIRIPENWILISRSNSSDIVEILPPDGFLNNINDQIRQYSRIKKVILYISQIILDSEMSTGSIHRTLEFSNPMNVYPWNIEFLGAYPPGEWIGIVKLGERWAKLA